MNERIWLSLAHMGGREQEFVKQAFDTNWVVPLGPNVDGFEKDIEQYLGGGDHVVALNAGTAAIHLGLILLGVQPGDEVICQSFTFAASANPITYLGATPVFVDSEPDTWNMSPEYLEQAIKDRISKGKTPKAIIPVHLYGMPAKMDEISEIAQRYSIPVLEDAAEALGSVYKGRKCGTLGSIGILSFNGNKIITTSGGGALVTKDPKIVQQAKFLATQARDSAPYYQHSQIGYNYRLSNICAGIGRGQMLVLDEHMQRRKAIHRLYRELLAPISQIEVFHGPGSGFDSNYWLTCITAREDRTLPELLRIGMDAANIETRPLWKPMHMQPVFSDAPYYGENVSKDLFGRGLCLPSGSSLTDQDIHYIVEQINRIAR